MENQVKKLLIGILFAAGLLGDAIAASPVVDSQVFQKSAAQVIGAGQSYFYYSGSDTITHAAGVAATGYDTTGLSGWLQIQWIAGQTGAYPNKDLSDTLTNIGANRYWLWVSVDTTTLSVGDSTGYGKWGDKDSTGLAKIWWRGALLAADTSGVYPAWLGDSTNIMVYDGAINEPLYGSYQFEESVGTLAQTRGIWRIYPVRLPPVGWVQFRYRASDAIKEATVVNWRLVAIRGM
jgi:hypothetical protein